MSILSLQLCLLGALIAVSQAQHSVTQDPPVLTLTTGQNVRMSCTLGGGLTVSSNRVMFVSQKDGNAFQGILYYFTDSNQGKAPGISDRFTASGSGNVGYLNIAGVSKEDEGVYHCATWTGSQWMFGNGTQLIIKAGEVKNPDVSLYPPSEEELKTGKASIVCTATNFAPRTAKLEWVVDGRTWNDDVSTTPISKLDSSGYMMSSILTMTASDYEAKRDNGKIIICKVTLEGKDFIKRLTRSECS